MDITTDKEILEFVNGCIQEGPDASLLLQYLIAVQQHYACIPEAAINRLQQALRIQRSQIDALIDFYAFLEHVPGAGYQILFSDNITDRFAGNQALFQQLKDAIDGENVSLDFTSCTGLCDQGPALLVNGRAVNHLDSERIAQIVTLIKQDKATDQWPSHWFEIEDHIPKADAQLSQSEVQGAGLRKLLEQGPEQVLDSIRQSGLRGRGGAGFPTASKWQFCKDADGTGHVVVCNADEGEPGTFKDRVLLKNHAHSVFEGMTLCAAVIGADKGYLYLRGEYLFLLDHLQQVLQQRREQGLLGKNILGKASFNFDIDIHLGAGAYICGEESALIESMEGKPGHPRIRPPFPVQQGYLGLPTVVNNVETFWSAAHIINNGSDWFSGHGTEQSKGTRLLSISGDCERPGIYEYPFGVSLYQILEDCGGSDAQAIQIAGAAGHLVLSKDFARCLSFEDLATGGSFMVIGKQRDLLGMLYNFATFFRHESCGFCTPCRVGSYLIENIMERFTHGQGSSADLEHLKQICKTMQTSSFCGLGTSAPTAFMDAISSLPELFEQRMYSRTDNPFFDLQQATSDYRRVALDE